MKTDFRSGEEAWHNFYRISFGTTACRSSTVLKNDELVKHGVFVRYYSTPPIEDFLRISVGLPEQNEALVTALGKILS